MTPTEQDAEPDLGLGTKAARGGMVQLIGYVLGRIPVLAATILIARIIAPAEFGSVAVALVVVSFLESIHDLGVGQAIVYLPDDRRTADSALVVAVVSSIVLFSLVLVFAPVAANLVDNPDADGLLRMLGITLILGAIAQVPDAIMRKRLQFGKRTVAILFRSFGRAGFSIVFALAGLGAWSIAWGYVLGDVVYLLAAWWLSAYRPALRDLRVDRARAREVVSFGAPVALAVMLVGLLYTVDVLLVAARLGSEAVGVYTLAQRIPDAGITRVFYVISGVAYPVFRAARDREGRLVSGYLEAIRIQVAFVFGVAGAIAASAPSLVPMLLGDDWLAATRPLQWLALHAAGMSLATGATDLFKAVGMPRLTMWATAAQLTVLAPLLYLAAGEGLDEVAAVAAFAALAFAVVMQGLACRILGISVGQVSRAVGPPLVIAGAAAGTMWLAQEVWSGSEILTILIQLSIGAATALVATSVVWRTAPGDIKRLIRLERKV